MDGVKVNGMMTKAGVAKVNGMMKKKAGVAKDAGRTRKVARKVAITKMTMKDGVARRKVARKVTGR